MPVDDLTRTSERSISLDVTARTRRLTQVFGPRDEVPRSLFVTKRVRLGREADDDGLVLDDTKASRQHAEIAPVRGYPVLRLTDLGSKNGTFLNGKRLTQPEYLRDGSVIRVGSSLFVFEDVEADPAQTNLDACPPDVGLRRFLAEHRAERGAGSDISILVRGPTGAGKEVLAQHVHAVSGRPGRLVTLNCATLSRDLLGSELFGHKKGAFSGAATDREGLFQAAHQGTLFLDEIGEMPLEQQPALLRAIQEKRVRPVGADDELEVDVRVLAATHRDLDELEEAGQFRADLLARLRGLEVELPGLNVRRVEILPLFRRFLGDTKLELTDDAAEALMVYGWPKNVRELKQAVDSVRLYDNEAEQIDLALLAVAAPRVARELSSEEDDKPTKEQLVTLLRKHDGNVSRVAKALSQHRTQVNRWLKAFGVEPSDYRS